MPETTCEETITYVVDPDVGPEHLKCDLPANHDGLHRDGTATWGPAKISRPSLADLEHPNA